MLGAQCTQGSTQSTFIEASRSPPSKNLSHVPCKFFRQGACQAGNTCPFSHSIDSQLEQAPCKYFQKGNCKFGAKCALAHILPDGRRVNHRSLPQNYGPLQLGARNVPPDLSSNNPSALARSLNAQHNNRQHNPQPPLQQPSLDPPEFGFEYGVSPPPDSYMSPSSTRTLGPLDVPLPASLESNGISFLARHGPIAASVPAKFGAADISPPQSVPQQSGNDISSLSSSQALRTLYLSAFGVDSEQAISSSYKSGVTKSRNGFMSLGTDEPISSSSSSPPLSNTGPTSMSSTPAPTMHSSHRMPINQNHSFGVAPPSNSSTGFPGRRHVSSSFPARSSIWRGSTSLNHDDEDLFSGANGSYHNVSDFVFTEEGPGLSRSFAYEEDFVPSSLNELLTPQERHRRGSQSSNSGRLGNTSGTIGEGVISSSPRGNSNMGESPRFGQLFHGHHSGASNSAASNVATVIGSPLRYSSLGAMPNGSFGQEGFVSTTTANTAISTMSSSPITGGRKFSAQTVHRTPSGRRVTSSSLVIEEDDEEDSSRNRRGQLKSSEDEEEDETQFIMDEEQLELNGTQRDLINRSADLDSSIDGMDATLRGLVLSR
ncbi:hypothetical protein V1512DRAFT_208720 [Lipomyces arxii]|uniref:uncharacterized protein n=1 Tax=Lipomyces arxii TaxID=56418 RepID=UPI0034CDA0FC